MSDFINELKDQSKIKAQNKYLVTYSSSFKKEIKLMKNGKKIQILPVWKWILK